MEEEKLLKVTSELKEIVGINNVNIDDLNKSIYSYDASMIKAKPCGVIHIKDIEQISLVVKVLHKYSIPFTARVAGTNLSGGATNQKGGFIINLSACNKIHQIDTINNIAVVEPGVVNLDLQKELERFGYFYAPDPASQKVSTIGGNIGENAGGPQCLKYGVTSNNIIKLDIVLPDGTECSYSINDIGPQIMFLFIGSEGTLGIVKKAYLKIIPLPKYFTTIYAEFSSLNNAMKSVTEVIKKGIVPKALEALDRLSIELTKGKEDEIGKDTEAILICEVDSDEKTIIQKEKEEIIKIFSENGAANIKYSTDKKESEKLFKLRKDAYPSLARISNNVLVEDGCVPRSKLVETVTNIKRIIDENGLKAGLVFHAGDGNIHPNIMFDERDVKETNRIRNVAKEILKQYIIAGGTISAEHGIGVEKRAFMLWQYNKETIELFRKIKKAIDENNISNPDKKIPIKDDIEKIKRREFEISENVKEIIEEISKRYKNKTPSIICGSSSSMKKTANISTKNFHRILDFDPDNMSITTEAGIEIKTLKKFLNSRGFDIPLPQEDGTIGGAIAENRYSELGNIILSMDIILSNSDFIRVGGKSIKDTSGYDIMRLMLGSMGTLGIITSVTIKIFKKAEAFKKMDKDSMIKNITPIHIRIKKAFDPYNLFNNFLTEQLYGIERY
ncbi:MAG: FAD-binding oxidoreductase [Elusimicrobiota bacterium]